MIERPFPPLPSAQMFIEAMVHVDGHFVGFRISGGAPPREPVPPPDDSIMLGGVRPLTPEEREAVIDALASAFVSAYRRLYNTNVGYDVHSSDRHDDGTKTPTNPHEAEEGRDELLP
jgi:hypothetical protein